MIIYSVEYINYDDYEFGYFFLNKEKAEDFLAEKRENKSSYSSKYWEIEEYEVVEE